MTTIRTSTTLLTRYGSTLFCLILSPFSRIFSLIVSCSCCILSVSERMTSLRGQQTNKKGPTNSTRISFSINLLRETISSADAVSSSSGRSLQVSAGGSGVTSIFSLSTGCAVEDSDVEGTFFSLSPVGGCCGGCDEAIMVGRNARAVFGANTVQLLAHTPTRVSQ